MTCWFRICALAELRPSGVNLGRLEMRENAGLAEGIDPNGLELRQIAGHAMNGGLNSCKVSLGRESESLH